MKTRIGGNRRAGFTLLELLVVVSILAILAGGLIVAYSGLDEKAGHGVGAYNAASLDSAIKNFAILNGGEYPNRLDSLLVSGTPGELIDRLDLSDENDGLLLVRTLQTGETASLGRLYGNNLDIQPIVPTVVDADASRYTNGDGNFDNDNLNAAPNNLFDDPTLGGVGVARDLADGGPVVRLSPTGVARLRLPNTAAHVVVFGLGKNSTIANPSLRGALSQVPFARVMPKRYGRFLLCFLVSNDGVTPLSTAKFVGVLDPHGHTADEAHGEYQTTN